MAQTAEKKEQVKPIIVTDETTGNKYTLEFSRQSVAFTEGQGFKPSLLIDNLVTQLPILWYGAFRMHHKEVSRHLTDKLLDNTNGLPPEVLERLLKLYNVPRKALSRSDDDEEEVKNAATTFDM